MRQTERKDGQRETVRELCQFFHELPVLPGDAAILSGSATTIEVAVLPSDVDTSTSAGCTVKVKQILKSFRSSVQNSQRLLARVVEETKF